jgi:diguanylate cyclase (GGDEF)-like protein
MQLIPLTLAAQLDLLSSVLGVVGAIILSFVTITLIASYYRFQHIVERADSAQPEEMGASADEVLRVQLARYLAGCARRGTSFTVGFIRSTTPGVVVRMDSPFVGAVKHAVRRGDIVCIYDEQTAVLIAESEPEDAEHLLMRTLGYVADGCEGVESSALFAGISSYPGHGLSGKELMDTALEGLGQTSVDQPVFMPEITDVDEEEEVAEEEVHEEAASDLDEEDHLEEDEEKEEQKGWRERRKSSMLDTLTGVLKPSVISAYMQRVMSELRRKKENAALFCIGVNNMEHIERFHGQEAADAVLVGVSKILQDNLRADDLIGRHEKYAFLVLAQCSLEEAEIIGKRISTMIQQTEVHTEGKRLKTSITLGVATYPDHGRNLHQLYMAGQRVLDHSRSNDIRAYAVYDPEIHDKVPSKPMKSIKAMLD